MAVTAGTDVTAEQPPGGHDGRGRHRPLGHRMGGPDGAGQDDSYDHGDHGAHGDHGGHGGHGGHCTVTARSKPARRVTATRTVLAIAEAPGGARTAHSDHGSGLPSERNRLLPARGAPTTPPSHPRHRGRKPTTRDWAARHPGERESKTQLDRARIVPWRKPRGCRCRGHCGHGAASAPTVAAVRPRARDESSPGHGDHGAHDGPCPPPGRVTKARPVTAVAAAMVAHAPQGP